MSRTLGIVIAAAVGALGLTPVAQAGFMVITPTSATANATTLYGSPTRVINGSGLAFPVPRSINSVADLPKHDEDAPNTMWATGNGATSTATMVFDLGAIKTIDTIYVWNYGEEAHASPGYPGGVFPLTNRGAKGVDIYYSVTSLNPLTPGVGGTLSESATFSQATNATLVGTNIDTLSGLDWNKDFNIVPVAYTLPSPVTGRYIEFNITSTYAGGFVGLSEVRFGVVPEPASLGLLALSGLTLLRRRGA